jgi:hypothetical protein
VDEISSEPFLANDPPACILLPNDKSVFWFSLVAELEVTVRSLIALAVATALSTSDFAAARDDGGIAHRLGGLGAQAARSNRYGMIYFPREYQPFWGDYCSNPPFGVPFDPLYYCYPGYYWDYGPPYYWMGYDASTSLPVASNLTTDVACGSWKWLTKERRYEWQKLACVGTEFTGATSGGTQ